MNLALCLNGKKGKRYDGESETFVSHTLRAEGFDASEDGTGRGTPIIPIDMRQASRGATMTNNRPGGSSGGAPGTGIGEPGDPAFTVCDSHPPAIAFYSNESHSSGVNDNISPTLRVGAGLDLPVCPAIAFDERQVTSRENRSNPQPGDPCHTLHEKPPALAAQWRGRGMELGGDVACSLRSAGDGHISDHAGYVVRHTVRRLTPRECERLQGFPDDWTRYAADGTELSDSARYRMLGNAVNREVAAWIGNRIVEAAQ